MVTNPYTCNANLYMEAKVLIASEPVNLKKMSNKYRHRIV